MTDKCADQRDLLSACIYSFSVDVSHFFSVSMSHMGQHFNHRDVVTFYLAQLDFLFIYYLFLAYKLAAIQDICEYVFKVSQFAQTELWYSIATCNLRPSTRYQTKTTWENTICNFQMKTIESNLAHVKKNFKKIPF